MTARRKNCKTAMRTGKRGSNLVSALRKRRAHSQTGKHQDENEDAGESFPPAQAVTTSEQLTWMRRDLQILFS